MSTTAQAPSPESINADRLRLALGLVSEGGVAKSAGLYYFDHWRPVPEHLVGVFDRLVWAGWVGVAAGDPIWARRGLSLTEVGQARYAAGLVQLVGSAARAVSGVDGRAYGAGDVGLSRTPRCGSALRQRPTPRPHSLSAGGRRRLRPGRADDCFP